MKSAFLHGHPGVCSSKHHTFQLPQPYQAHVLTLGMQQKPAQLSAGRLQQIRSSVVALSSRHSTDGASTTCSTPATSSRVQPAKHSSQQQQQVQLEKLQSLSAQVASICAAAVITVSSCLGPVLLTPAAAEARPRLTPDEQVSVDIFRKSTPSVVNVTNLTAR
jgi:hypothetical protein